MNDDIPDIRTLRRDRPTRTPARLALELLVMPILWALPFAAFFGTLNSEGARAYQLAFFASLFFSYCIRWALLAVESFVVPRLHRTLWNDPQAWIAIGAAYIAAAVLASYLAAFLIDTFLWSTFLEGPRSFIVVSFYTLTFTTLIPCCFSVRAC